MKVLAKRNVAVNGQHLEVGEIREVNDSDAQFLIRLGKVEEAPEAPACPPTIPKAVAAPKKPKIDGDS